MTRFFAPTLLLLLAGLAGCSSPAPHNAPAPDTTIHLAATLVTPNDVALKWNNPAPGAAGYIVEYATQPDGDFTVLVFCPPSQTTFTHPHLMEGTTFYYRVRPIYGPASNMIDLSLPRELSDEAYAAAYASPEDYSWAPPKTIPETTPVEKKSIRDPATAAEAAPTDLSAAFVISTVSGFKLTWTNHSSDEEGFFLEMKDKDSPDFRICAVTEPKVNSFGWAFHPPQREASLRIRAYYYGKSSNVVSETTGPDAPVLPSSTPPPPGG
jgi:hypothetical protein